MYKRIVLFAIVISIAHSQQQLSFHEAFQRRLEVDSGLLALSHQRTVLSLSKELSQAFAPTEFESVLENFGQDEIEFSARQVFEAPSIRRNRLTLVDAELGIIENNARTYQDEIHYRLSMYFLESVHWNKRLALAEERLVLTEQILDWQNHQFKQGALSESELIRSRLETARQEADLSQIKTSIERYTMELSAYLDTSLISTALPMVLPHLPTKNAIEAAWKQPSSSPVIRDKQAHLNTLKAMIAVEDIPLISSFSLSAGMKILPELNQQFPIIGISIESPLFTKRKVAVKLRDYEFRAGMSELDNISSQFEIERERWMSRWLVADQQLSNLRASLIPEAKLLYQRIETEYRAGARPYLEVLDAQSLLTDLQENAMTLQIEQSSLLFELSLTLGVKIYEFN
ncbi:MAG: TolC family protein [Candidatus Marinimicrobia bacterium]|nr:TolC family protein [Candidatus Neomarinimicrobiota bacterium]